MGIKNAKNGAALFFGELFLWGEKISFPLSLYIRRRIGFVPQTPYLFNCTVIDNVCYPLWVLGVGKKERMKIGFELLTKVKLEKLSLKQAAFLSGGEAGRLALARALAGSPELLLLDEITAHLDPVNIAIIENLLVETKKHSTIIIAIHNMEQAKRLADKIIVLSGGRVAEPEGVFP